MKRTFLATLGLACVAILSGTLLAQGPGGFRGGPGGPGGFGGGFGGPGTDMFGLLNNDQVKQEIDLIPSQEEELQELGQKMRERMMSVFREMRNASDEERQEIFARAREAREEVQEEVESILLPHQVDRLKQISTQQQLRARGGAGVNLANGPIAEELGLSEQQIAELREKAEKLQAEMQQKLQELRKQAEEELLTTLTPEQQAKYKELVGEPFELEMQRGFQRGGPQRGEAGEGRRGRGGERRGPAGR